MILISNDRTSPSKKINGMALIRTLTVSSAAFEKTKEKFYGFQQTEIWDRMLERDNNNNRNNVQLFS